MGRQISPHQTHRPERPHQPSASPGNSRISAGSPASENRRVNALAASRSRGSLEQLDQQRRREQRGEIGEAPASTCSHAHGRAVVPDLVDILELHFGDRRFVLHIPGTSPERSCGNKAHILRRSLQLGFQVQNDIVEQTSRHGIRSFSCQYSVAFHLISALVPIFAVSHGDVPPCSDPQREYISSSN